MPPTQRRNPKTGWIPSRFLEEIVGQTVKLHPEPLSEQFVIVTGTLETLVELANWRKVKVTAGAEILVGWIDMNATAGRRTGHRRAGDTGGR